ncbi:MAG: xanthine dehydrogenase family protein molybdopterin-binding subunit [Alphaproteobacteria bacterium]|nr:xanthine dehydrogenase family protein molybdopterin-binding subunit [Alphaproteobacteria bacterium]
MTKFGIGQPVRRGEDRRLLTGRGRYTGDIRIDGAAHAVFVRSPFAHADIAAISLDAALAAPGVVACFTHTDLDADRVRPIPCQVDIRDKDGRRQYDPPRPVLGHGVARFVGEPLIMVVAANADQARDAAELIDIDYRERQAVIDTGTALDPATPVIWPECPGGNCGLHWERGDASAVDQIFKQAAHVAEVRLVQNRVIANPMEPRGAVADYDSEADRITLYSPTQGVHRVHHTLASLVLGLPAEKIRIVSRDVGGAFGVRSKTLPEMVAVAWAARKLGRPVQWSGDRAETMVIDNHGRDNVTHAALGLDAEGKILALKIDNIANMGAYHGEFAPMIPTLIGPRTTGTAYVVPALYNVVRTVFTNTVPVDSYRGAGRPETAYIMERLMDGAARVTGLDRLEIRRRNYIPPDAMPYRTTQDLVIDSGEFATVQERAIELADWRGFAKRRCQSEARGKRRGIGIGTFVEASGGITTEEGRVELHADGSVTARTGLHSHGQAHATTFAQVIADKLGLAYESIHVIHAYDTDEVAYGNGSTASRGAHMGGTALARACDAVIAKAKTIAAHALQTDAGAVSFADGMFHAGGAEIALTQVAALAADPAALPAGTKPGLDETHRYERDADIFTYPNGCHIAEVEIDPGTGVVTVERYAGVDDTGIVLNPMIVHGQTQGGIAQGLGQALIEDGTYDPATGQLMAATFMDYAMPRAADMPRQLELAAHEVPCTTNDLGVKGAGEGGVCGAPPAIVSAVLDALKDDGVTAIDMPLTSERVWRAIHDAAK